MADTRCTVADCRTVAVHHEVLPLCRAHRDLMALALTPEVLRRYPPHLWTVAKRDFEAQFGTVAPVAPPVRPLFTRARPRDSQASAIVYFIVVGDRVKIGTTTNLRGRMTTLTLASDARVALTIPGGVTAERREQNRYAKQRIGTSEWFHLEGDLAARLAA